MPVSPERLAEALDGLRGGEFLGANVTIPHKEAALKHLDTTDPWASSIGAVNTIVKDGPKLTGHNTDAYGFMTSLKEKAGFDPKGSIGAPAGGRRGRARGGLRARAGWRRVPDHRQPYPGPRAVPRRRGFPRRRDRERGGDT